MEKFRLHRVVGVAIVVMAIAMGLYHLISTQYLLQHPTLHQNTHFAFGCVIVFLLTLKKRTRLWPVMLALILLSLAATTYVAIFFPDLELRKGFPTTADMVVGIILVVVALEGTREAFGPVVAILAIIFIAYAFWGNLAPEPFYHRAFTPEEVVSHLSIGLHGMYGTALGVSTNYIFLFFLFGGLLRVSGAMEFFVAFGKLAGRKLKGGPAQTAVVSSALVGSVSGSGMANVAITGAFTIPMMKSVGYKPEQAGAIEAAASDGGQIMPPVMGAAAFLMAGLTGISYIKIMAAAIIPALLYFLSVGLFTELQARKMNLSTVFEEVNIKEMLLKMPAFVLPLLMLIGLLARGFSPMYAAFWAIIGLFVVSFVVDYITGVPLSLRRYVDGFVTGVTGGARIAVTSAVIGFMAAVMTLTGIGIKLSGAIADWSGGVLIIAAAITMCASILLGMGVPTLVSYALVALVVAPVLIDMGVTMLQAHFFCFFFAVFAGVTPPVALDALVASGIAGSSYIKTAFTSWKVCLVAFIIPYIVLWNPTLLLRPADPLSGALTLIAVVLGLLPIAAVVTGYYITRLRWLEVVLAAASAVGLIGYAFTISYIFLAGGVILLALLTAWQLRNRRLLEPVLEVAGNG